MDFCPARKGLRNELQHAAAPTHRCSHEHLADRTMKRQNKTRAPGDVHKLQEHGSIRSCIALERGRGFVRSWMMGCTMCAQRPSSNVFGVRIVSPPLNQITFLLVYRGYSLLGQLGPRAAWQATLLLQHTLYAHQSTSGAPRTALHVARNISKC